MEPRTGRESALLDAYGVDLDEGRTEVLPLPRGGQSLSTSFGPCGQGR
ncbi:hypothetical protein [Frankia sp. CiP3]|nr:hypothetical protein [Frankia sp. CiP3]